MNAFIRAAAMAAFLSFAFPAWAASGVVTVSPTPVGHLVYTEVNAQYGLLVWSVRDFSGVYAQVVDRAGNTPVGDVFVLAPPNGLVEDPVLGRTFTLHPGLAGVDPAVAAAADSRTALVAWFAGMAGTPGFEVVGRTVTIDAAGAPTLSAIRRLSHADDDTAGSRQAFFSLAGRDPLAIAFNPDAGEFLVAWDGSHDNDEDFKHIFAQRVNVDGTAATDASAVVAPGYRYRGVGSRQQ